RRHTFGTASARLRTCAWHRAGTRTRLDGRDPRLDSPLPSAIALWIDWHAFVPVPGTVRTEVPCPVGLRGEQIATASQLAENRRHVLGGVVRVQRDAEVVAARRRDDALTRQLRDEALAVGRPDADERAPTRPIARGHDGAAELLDALDQQIAEPTH